MFELMIQVITQIQIQIIQVAAELSHPQPTLVELHCYCRVVKMREKF